MDGRDFARFLRAFLPVARRTCLDGRSAGSGRNGTSMKLRWVAPLT